MLVRTDKWVEPVIEAGLLDADDYAATAGLISANEQYLVPRYAHGDLMPYAHVFTRPDGRMAFIDFEHYSARKPRYYDAAYGYAQMFIKISDTSIAGHFMGSLLDKAESVDHQPEQMMTVIAQRAIRLYFDAVHDEMDESSQFVQRTKHLLDIAMNGDIDMLVHPSC
jgi:hypothetical protein